MLIRSPEGQAALIDAGPGVDLVPKLRQMGVEKIDLLVASHPHADHIGGMVQVIQAMPVRYFMDNGLPHTTATYSRLLEAVRHRTEISYLEATPRTITLGSAKLEVLPLPEGETDQNNRSVALLVRYGAFLALLSGDSDRRELSWLLEQGAVPDVALLKAPHHGSDNGFTLPFLRAAQPEIVVISVGANNSYGHPGTEALAAYQSTAGQVLRTDLGGDVTVSGYEGGRFEVRQGRPTPASVRQPSSVGRGPQPVRSPSSAGTTTTGIELGVVADAPGNDHQNPNGEYAVVDSHSSVTCPSTAGLFAMPLVTAFGFPKLPRCEPGVG